MQPLKTVVETARQNKPSRLALEMVEASGGSISYDQAMEMLLRHGVFKWFAARRDLIRLKNDMREYLTFLMHSPRSLKGARKRRPSPRAAAIVTLNWARESIRAICHQPRCTAPDHDREAARWLYHKLNPEEAANG